MIKWLQVEFALTGNAYFSEAFSKRFLRVPALISDNKNDKKICEKVWNTNWEVGKTWKL